MPKRFKEARQLKKIKLIDAAKILGVSQPTLSSWEGERKSPSLDNLLRMAQVYGVTTDYLLGNDYGTAIEEATVISKQVLPILHGKPVWIPQLGWALVNAIDKTFLLTNGNRLQFDEVDSLLPAQESFYESSVSRGPVLCQEELTSFKRVWVEPISKDFELRQELRGWYYLKGRFFENDAGNRFALDSYGAKWIAFESNK